MGVDGIRRAVTQRVVLDEFFDKPAWVDIKPLGPYAKAQIRETLMAGFDIKDIDQKSGSASVANKSDGAADREMKVRNIKLASSIAGHSITMDGSPAAWGKELWDQLDEADPRILEKVLGAIDGQSNPSGGDEVPTSPLPTSGK